MSNWFSREALKNHFQYAKWVYVLIFIGVFFVSDLLFTMTAYRAPAERKVDIQVVGYLGSTEGLQQVCDKILPEAQQLDPTLEEINALNIVYSGDAETDIYGAQKFMVMLGAQEGDIYIVNRPLLEMLAGQGGALPLDAFIERGLLPTEGVDLDSVRVPEPVLKEGAPPSGIQPIYALPAASMGRMQGIDIGYDNADKYLVIMQYSKNPETTALVMGLLMDALSAPAPEAAP